MSITTRLCWCLSLSVAVAILSGCGGKESQKPDDSKPVVNPDKRDKEKKDREITADDLRKAAEAAGGKLDTTPPTPKAPESLDKVKPDVVLTVEDVEAKYAGQAEWYADLYKNYYGKVIELKGLVDNAGFADISLKSTKIRPFPLSSRESEPFKKVFPGQTVVVRTRIKDIYIWEIIESKGPTPVEFTADQYAREMAGDSDQLKKKFEGKYLIVTGVIDSVDIDKIGHATVKLKTENGASPPVCRFLGATDEGKMRNKTLKAGMKLKTIGKWDDFDRSLRPCELLELTP